MSADVVRGVRLAMASEAPDWVSRPAPKKKQKRPSRAEERRAAAQVELRAARTAEHERNRTAKAERQDQKARRTEDLQTMRLAADAAAGVRRTDRDRERGVAARQRLRSNREGGRP